MSIVEILFSKILGIGVRLFLTKSILNTLHYIKRGQCNHFQEISEATYVLCIYEQIKTVLVLPWQLCRFTFIV